MQQNPTYDILHHAKVSDVITPKAVITLDSEDTVEKAVKVKHCPQHATTWREYSMPDCRVCCVCRQVLAQNHIQSAPVVNSKTNEVLGMVDMLDIVAFILSVAPSGHQLSVCAPLDSGEASIAHQILICRRTL